LIQSSAPLAKTRCQSTLVDPSEGSKGDSTGCGSALSAARHENDRASAHAARANRAPTGGRMLEPNMKSATGFPWKWTKYDSARGRPQGTAYTNNRVAQQQGFARMCRRAVERNVASLARVKGLVVRPLEMAQIREPLRARHSCDAVCRDRPRCRYASSPASALPASPADSARACKPRSATTSQMRRSASRSAGLTM